MTGLVTNRRFSMSDYLDFVRSKFEFEMALLTDRKRSEQLWFHTEHSGDFKVCCLSGARTREVSTTSDAEKALGLFYDNIFFKGISMLLKDLGAGTESQKGVDYIDGFQNTSQCMEMRMIEF